MTNHHLQSRRRFIERSLASGLSVCSALSWSFPARAETTALAPTPWPENMLNLASHFSGPVKLASLELLRNNGTWLIRATSTDGVVGLAVCNERIEDMYPLLLRKVMPFFLKKDLRELESLVDGVYAASSNYKYAGVGFWNCVGWVEFALFDLLGKTAGKSVGELLGGILRKEIPVYLSSLRRDTTPEQEVEWISKRIEETAAKAVKIKIGGRMSRNADASPGRTESLVKLARKKWGDDISLLVDANSSYDAPKAIEVGWMLEDQGVTLYEEPCPWEDFESTRKVAEVLKNILVAGGEQDTSYEKFAWYAKNRGLDVFQADVNYNGGFIRTLRVAKLAAKHNIECAPHAPQLGMSTAYLLHFASVTPNLWRFQEFRAEKPKPQAWLSPNFEAKNGVIPVPEGPGLGMAIDPDWLAKAEVMKPDKSGKGE